MAGQDRLNGEGQGWRERLEEAGGQDTWELRGKRWSEALKSHLAVERRNLSWKPALCCIPLLLMGLGATQHNCWCDFPLTVPITLQLCFFLSPLSLSSSGMLTLWASVFP